MKKLAFLFAILLGMVFSSVAQEKQNFWNPKLGIMVGYNLTTIKSNTGLLNRWKPAANFGVVANFSSNNSIFFRTGLYLSMKGYKEKSEDTKIKFNYLEIPLLAVYQKPLNQNIKLEAQAGLYFAYGIFGKTKFETTITQIVNAKTGKVLETDEDYFSTPISDWLEQDITKDSYYVTFDYHDRFDCGINFGLGMNISHFYFGGSFEYGLKDIIYNATNRCFMVNLGYNFL